MSSLVRIGGQARFRRGLAAVLVVGTAAAMVILGGIAAAPPASAQSAQPPLGLGTAASFAVLAGSTVTNTGPSNISGDLGVSPGTAVTGFPPGQVNNGTIHAADAVGLQAQSDLTTAYNDAAGRTPATAAPADLGGQTLAPGVYNTAGPMGLTGTVTLDAQNDPNAVFIFQAGSTLITASSSTVALIRGASPCNVFWQVGSSATLGTDTTFVGNILALTSASLQTRTTVNGRVLARNGQVSLDNNTITRPSCTTPTTTTTPPTTTTTTTTTTAPPTSATPAVTGLIPSSGPETGGTTVTVTGSGFTGATAASFGPRPAPAAVLSDTQIRTTSPAGTGTVHVTVAKTGFTSPTGPADQFTYARPSARTGGPEGAGNAGGGAGGQIIPKGHPETGVGGAARTGDTDGTGVLLAGCLAVIGAGGPIGRTLRRGPARPARDGLGDRAGRG